MELLGRKYSYEDLLRRCNPDVLYGARRVELCDGRGRVLRIVEVKTSAGLRVSFIEDKCLDILDMEYKGVNIGFLSKNAVISGAATNPETDSFTKYWSGGFLATCGLRNTGPSCCIDGEFFPIHGRIGVTPAENVNVSVDNNEIIITGKVMETALFGPRLEMNRKITIPSGGAQITINDTIKNLTPETETIFLLYHINFGFPFLSEDLTLVFPEAQVSGRTDLARDNIHSRTIITPPIDGEPELVYFYRLREKDAIVGLINQQLGIKAMISYDSGRLPVLSQWKSMRSGDYALGIEPGTSFIRGRKEEIEDGYDIRVPCFGSLEYGVTILIEEIKS